MSSGGMFPDLQAPESSQESPRLPPPRPGGQGEAAGVCPLSEDLRLRVQAEAAPRVAQPRPGAKGGAGRDGVQHPQHEDRTAV